MYQRILPVSLLALLPLTGCILGGATTIDPVWEIEPEETVVVVPFKEPDFQDRWDSPTGNRLAELTTQLLAENADFEVCPYRKVLELYAAEKKDVRQLRPRDVAALTKADYVIVCDVERWDPSEVKGVGITQANTRAKARLFKVDRKNRDTDEEAQARVREQNEARKDIGLEPVLVERGGDFVSTVEVNAKYPDTFMGQEGETFLDQAEAEAGLIAALAREVALLYYEHEEEFKKHKGR